MLALVAALFVSACGSDDDEKQNPPRPITLMTFNVLCSLCNLQEYDPWAERLVYFEDIFARYDPDLIGLQELTPLNGEVDQVLAHAPDRSAVYFHPEDRPPYPDATIVYRTSRFEELEHGEYWLSPTPDVPSSSGFASPQLPRLVVWARLRDRAGDRELYFATTHFDNNSPSQELSAPLVLERTAPWTKTHPVIVNGDFNSRPDSTAYGILTGGFQNAFDLAAEWHVDTNQSPEPAYDLDDRIDHNFLAGEGVGWTVSSWVVDLTVYGDKQRYPSDHFPIVSVVEY